MKNPVRLALAGALLAAPSLASAPILDCEPRGGASPVCLFQNPEDLAALPGGQAILVSEYAGMLGEGVGSLSLFSIRSGERRVAFQGADAGTRPTPGWGERTCPGPPPGGVIAPHGIDLAPRPDGRMALAVVQHAGRDSIEVFEVSGTGVDWRLAWRGCVLAPADSWLNDVVWLPDGSFVTSSMMPKSEGIERMMRRDQSPGMALHWRAGRGFEEVPGTRGALPNGVEVSADGRKLFLNLTFANEVRRIDLASGAVEGAVKVEGPDNSTWSPDGRLIVASLRSAGSEDCEVCRHVPPGACPIPFTIVAVDPASLATHDLYTGDGGPGGLGTVGLVVGDELFVGTASGDRVLRVKLAPGGR